MLPLPVNPRVEMRERETSSSALGSEAEREIQFHRQFGYNDESRYESARWWRRLNRYMSILGVLLVAAVVRSSQLPLFRQLTNRVTDHRRGTQRLAEMVEDESPTTTFVTHTLIR
jgi:hypothetical protein